MGVQVAGKNLPWSHWGKITCRLHLELVTRCITILFTVLVLPYAQELKNLLYFSMSSLADECSKLTLQQDHRCFP